jgi:hypothetical protein
MNTPNILDTLQAFYLEWVNDYLTTGAIAEAKGLTHEQATTLINTGREIHEARVLAHAKQEQAS